MERSQVPVLFLQEVTEYEQASGKEKRKIDPQDNAQAYPYRVVHMVVVRINERGEYYCN